MLEQSRITFQSKDERNYHVFYQLLAGGDKAKYLLDPIASYKYLNQSGCTQLDGVDDSKLFEQLNMAFTVLNIDEDTASGLFSLVSAVLHCGNLEFTPSGDGESVSLSPAAKATAGKIAKLLGVRMILFVELTTHRTLLAQTASD